MLHARRFAVAIIAVALFGVASVHAASVEVTAADVLTTALPAEPTSDLTIEAWLRPSQNVQTAYALFHGSLIDSVNGFGLIIHDGYRSTAGDKASLVLANVAYSATGNSARLKRGAWTHIAIVRADSVWLLYRNGMLVGTSRLPAGKTTARLLLTRQFYGAVDDVRVWDMALDGTALRRRMSRRLVGNEEGLVAWYPIDEQDGTDGVLRNRATVTAGTLDVPLGGARVVFASAPEYTGLGPSVEFDEMPAHMQFLPRGSETSARVRIVGSARAIAADSLGIELWRNDTLLRRSADVVSILTTGECRFGFTERIEAELALYTVRLVERVDGEWRYLAEAADLVAGDALIICGQSNSHPTDAAASWTSPFLRSFGVQTPNGNYNAYDPADTLWGAGNGHGHGNAYTGPYVVGVWGVQLARRMIDTFRVPVCIINGGAGGSSIEQNQRNDANPTDPATIYGRTLLRARAAGVDGVVREIFWHQGESNTISGYFGNFAALRQDWREDYPALQRIYLFQIRPGCGGVHSPLRELQRTMGDSFPDVVTMATVGIPGHDGCHYAGFGYIAMGDQAFRRLAADRRGVGDVVWPSIRSAWFIGPGRDTLALRFDAGARPLVWTADTLAGGRTRSLVDAFTLQGATADSLARIDAGWTRGDTVFLRLSAASFARSISYVPDKYYADTALIYEGPWLLRADGLGAFTFDQFPINDRLADIESERGPAAAIARLRPNPARASATLTLDLPRAGGIRIELVDTRGARHLALERRCDVGRTHIELDLSAAPAGILRCAVFTDEGLLWTGPVVVMR